jgi:N-formylglutamate amidohydrolase
MWTRKMGNMETTYNITYTKPMLFLAIHNGHNLSPAISAKIGISEMDRMREEDPFTERFISDKENYIIQHTSRFEYDINRKREKAVYITPNDCWGLPIYPHEKLTEDEIRASLAKYDNFYQELIKIIEIFLQKHEKLIVWDIHSYNHRRKGPNAEFDSNEENPEIILGTNNYQYMPLSWKPTVDRIEELLKGQEFVGSFKSRFFQGDCHNLSARSKASSKGFAMTGTQRLDCFDSKARSNLAMTRTQSLDVRQNIKFPGGYLSQFINYKYGDRVCCIAVEFKKIWMDEWTQEIDEPCLSLLKEIFNNVCNANNVKASS